MSRLLSDLSSDARPLVDALLGRLAGDGVDVKVISVLRSMEEHRANLLKGVSSAVLSFHLPRAIRTKVAPGDPDAMKSDACDLVLVKDGRITWDTSLEGWQAIGHHAEAVGLEWGGRWKKPYDPGHVQVPRRVWHSGL